MDCSAGSPGGGEQAEILKAVQVGRPWRHLGRSKWESAILDDEPWCCQVACCSREWHISRRMSIFSSSSPKRPLPYWQRLNSRVKEKWFALKHTATQSDWAAILVKNALTLRMLSNLVESVCTCQAENPHKMFPALPACAKHPIKVSCRYLISFSCNIATYPNFASLHSCSYFHTILQTSRLKWTQKNTQKLFDGEVGFFSTKLPSTCLIFRSPDRHLMTWSQLPPPKCLSEVIDEFIYLFLQQIFIKGLLCARFGAWECSLLLVHLSTTRRNPKMRGDLPIPPSHLLPCHCWLLNNFHFPDFHSSCDRTLWSFSLLCFGNVSPYYQNKTFDRPDLGKDYTRVLLPGLFTWESFILYIRIETTTTNSKVKFPAFPNVPWNKDNPNLQLFPKQFCFDNIWAGYFNCWG